jgi:hypothetical protein
MKAKWKRAYQLARLIFRDELAATQQQNQERLTQLSHVARYCWVKGNTDWRDYDKISQYRERYSSMVNYLYWEKEKWRDDELY